MSEKHGKLEWIDIIKGFAAISVVLLHASSRAMLTGSFAYVHIWHAVPLFVFVSFYLFFRKLDRVSIKDWYSRKNIGSVLRNVFLPFLLIQLIFIAVLIVSGNWDGVKHLLIRGGSGRGSYYFYVYCQIWVLAPFLYYLLSKTNKNLGGLVILLISIALNLVLSLVIKIDRLPVRVESVLAIRYLFMAVVAYQFLRNPDSKLWIFVLPIISIVYWLLKIDFFPWIPRGSWYDQQFPAFFYTFFLVWLLRLITPKLPKKIRELWCWLGVNSWYIFLTQMLFFKVLPIKRFGSIVSLPAEGVALRVAYMIVALLGAILPVVLFRWCEKMIKNRKIHVLE